MGNKEIIQQKISELLKMMGFAGEIKVEDNDPSNIIVNINTQEANFLIGQAGANLDSLQHLSRILVNKEIQQPIHFIVDVNSYRKNRIELLRQMAKDIAKKASLEQIAITLQPMPAYERRLIHLCLADHPEVTTQSAGQKQERKIVIKPIKGE